MLQYDTYPAAPSAPNAFAPAHLLGHVTGTNVPSGRLPLYIFWLCCRMQVSVAFVAGACVLKLCHSSDRPVTELDLRESSGSDLHAVHTPQGQGSGPEAMIQVRP